MLRISNFLSIIMRALYKVNPIENPGPSFHVAILLGIGILEYIIKSFKMNEGLEYLRTFIGKDASNSPSPLMRWLNPTILEVSEGRMILRFVVRKDMTNPVGILHGGATAAIIDDAIGVTTFTFEDKVFYTTINLTIDYLSSAAENDVIVAETTIVKKGRQFVNAECHVWNADKSKLIAKGSSNLFKTEKKTGA